MSRVLDAFHVLVGKAEIAVRNEVHAIEGDWIALEQLIHTEEQRVEEMITDALANLANAVHAILTERDSDKAALTQAQSDLATAQQDRDAALAQVTALQGQLSDAENQINALTTQISMPPAPEQQAA